MNQKEAMRNIRDTSFSVVDLWKFIWSEVMSRYLFIRSTEYLSWTHISVWKHLNKGINYILREMEQAAGFKKRTKKQDQSGLPKQWFPVSETTGERCSNFVLEVFCKLEFKVQRTKFILQVKTLLNCWVKCFMRIHYSIISIAYFSVLQLILVPY